MTAAAAKVQPPAADPLRPPAEVAPIATVIGAAATLRLVEQMGGLRITVPSRARPTSALGKVIGAEALKALVQAYGGNTLYVPLCKYWRVKVLRVRDGLSYSEIARALGMNERTVYGYLNAAGMTASQPRLPGF